MITVLIKQQTLSDLARHRLLQDTVDTKGPVSTVSNPHINSKDIYGQDKTKLKTSETSRYFQCDNCGRKIAGGRFAQHINKCLERRRR